MIKLQVEVYMESLADRLRIVREEKGLSLRALAKELNIHFSTLGSYEQGRRNPDVETLARLANYYGVSTDYLLGIVDIPKVRLKGEVKLKPSKPQKMIPLLGRVSAGNGVHAEDDVIGEVSVDADEAVDFALTVQGHSMHPKFMNGDIVFVRKQPTVRNGQIAVVRINGEDGVIKYFFKRADGVVLKSENPEYKPQFIPATKWDQECGIIGIVTSFTRYLIDES
jgi:repressor LexA